MQISINFRRLTSRRNFE